MIRMFLRTIGWGVFVVLLVGCSVFPLRKESSSAASRIAHSRSAAYHYSLGILHALNENPDEAIREMDEALRIDPDSAYLAGELASLPPRYHQFSGAPPYPVRKSERLLAIREHAVQRESRN